MTIPGALDNDPKIGTHTVEMKNLTFIIIYILYILYYIYILH
jgi:hypothetical protein